MRCREFIAHVEEIADNWYLDFITIGHSAGHSFTFGIKLFNYYQSSCLVLGKNPSLCISQVMSLFL